MPSRECEGDFIGSIAGEGDDKVLRDESSWVFIGMGKRGSAHSQN